MADGQPSASECPCCREPFRHPRLLPCLHTLCNNCCEDLLKCEITQRFCPICREAVTINELNQLPCNITVPDASEVHLCVECDEGQHTPSTYHCATCSYLCNLHYSHHQQSRSKKDHVIRPIDIVYRPAPQCKTHPDQQCDLTCDTCKAAPLCARCAIEQHNGHVLLTEAQLAEKNIMSLSKDLYALLEFFSPLNKALPTLYAGVQESRQSEEKIKTEILQAFGQVIQDLRARIQQLELRRDSLVKEACSIIQSRTKVLEMQAEELSALAERGNVASRQMQAMISELSCSRKQSSIMAMNPNVQKCNSKLQASIPILEPLIRQSVRFQFPRGDPAHLPVSLLGQLIQTHPDIQNIQGAWIITGPTNANFFKAPHGLAVVANDVLVVADSNKKCLHLVSTDKRLGSSDQRLIKSIGVGLLQNPHYVTISPRGHIWVADFGGNSVQCFDPETGSRIQTISITTPVGVAILPSGDICCTDYSSHRVRIYSSTGVQLREIGSSGSGPGCFTNPCGLAVLDNGNLVVVDCSNHRLQVISQTGVFICEIGKGVLRTPTGVAVIQNNYIAVSEVNSNRISVWTETGVHVTTWGAMGSSPGLFNYPRGIVQLADGRIAVADEKNSRVQLF